MSNKKNEAGLYIVLVSIHGLMRGHSLELGRDADTGGQIKYVLELARALAANPEVGRVDLLTRQVTDPKVSPDYAKPIEEIAPGAHIVRIVCGPRRYLRKEVLWPHLDSFVDNAITYIRKIRRSPDIIHSHYADAGYAGARLSQLLGVPLVHTGHSLGRVKLQRLQDNGLSQETIEKQYNVSQRIEAEEIALGNEALVIASTRQEVEQQYTLYENYHPQRMTVIPPGVDLDRFRIYKRGEKLPPIAAEINRFLKNPNKPMILALCRPDPRKNIETLICAYGENRELREMANLVIVAGNRGDITTMDKSSREVLTQMLMLIDRFDLYGSAAYIKHHEPNDVPDMYRLAAKTRGIFINPALTEPFGLTLIEAAASGLPVVATNDGGPGEIIRNCKNGMLIDPLDADAMGNALLDSLLKKTRWSKWRQGGIRGANKYYTWEGHVTSYLRAVKKIISKRNKARITRIAKSRMPIIDRMIITDLDNTLIGDDDALQQLLQLLNEHRGKIGFGIATGRRLESVMKVIRQYNIPTPDVLITAVGTEIHYGHGMVEDKGWRKHINYRWKPEALLQAMEEIPGLKLQAQTEQLEFKISYNIDPEKVPSMREIRRHLRQLDLHAKLIYSHEAYLDLLPVRASKGLAVRHLAMRWDLPPETLLVAGDSGNDDEMLSGNTLGLVVGNYSPELEHLCGRPRIYFAEGEYTRGILEGIEYYNFTGDIHIPDDREIENV